MSFMPSPMPISKDDMGSLDADSVAQVKNVYCAFYDECLDQALRAKWDGFGCGSCAAYQMIDPFQLKMDTENLLMMFHASVSVVKRGYFKTTESGQRVWVDGGVNRRRGAKPKSDTRTRVHLPVIAQLAVRR